jgi:uncharacterized membrane protein
MLRYMFTFMATLLAMFVLDAVWITFFAGPWFRETLGVVMALPLRVAPAFIFYPLYVTGIMVFVVAREDNFQSLGQTFMFGALFGLFTYGTFDLTSLTILAPYTPFLALTDIAWGVFLTATASVIGVFTGEQIVHFTGR